MMSSPYTVELKSSKYVHEIKLADLGQVLAEVLLMVPIRDR